jgi:hypothetical protein
MKTNKNIDRLFQEKLKDFEASPPASVWEGIQSNIHPKNPKSSLPLWLKISGAAAIMLLITLGGINYFDKNPNEIIITDTKEIENTPTNENSILNPVLNNSDENNSVITDATQNNDNVSETLKVNTPKDEKQLKFYSTTTNNNKVSEVSNKKENNLSNTGSDLEIDKEISENKSSTSTIADVNINNLKSKNVNSKDTSSDKLLKLNKEQRSEKSKVANELTNSNTILNNLKNKVLNTNSENIIANNDVDKQNVINTNNKSSSSNEIFNSLSDKTLNTDSESLVTINDDIKNKNFIKTDKSNNVLNNTNKSILNTSENNTIVNNSKSENILNNTVANNKVEIIEYKKEKFGEKTSIENNLDSIQKGILKSEDVVAVTPNKYDELLKTDLNEDIEEEEGTKKWSVASTIAPIYYNSFNTKGSPLDLQFKDSPKTGSKSIAYGVKVGYKLNDKLTLQAGVSKIDVGYKIGDVFINPTQQYQVRLTNVNYANTNTAAILNVNANSFLDDTLIETNATTGFTGELNQSFGYIEIPLELKYSITDTSKKLGVNLIGGVSTLLLNKNDVFVSTSEFSSSLGEANNLNKVNFSGNIGVDIDYKINKRIYINVAPMLKIHTKTFSNSDSNFEPYLFGVYTGLNYRF